MLSLICRGLLTALALSAALGGVALALDPKQSLDQLVHRTYTRDDGAPGQITGIRQTADGYILVSSWTGLYRFDGVSFEQIWQNELLSSKITGLGLTASGDLWIGYLDAGLTRVRDGKFEHFPVSNGAPGGRVGAARDAPNGDIWVVANNLPWRFDGQVWKQIEGDWNTDLRAGGGIWSGHIDSAGTYWAKDGQTLSYCRPGCQRFVRAPGYAGGVLGIGRDADGRLWTSDTLAPGRMYRLPSVIDANAPIAGPEYGATVPPSIGGTITIDRDGSIWNTTPRSGIQRVRGALQAGAVLPAPEVFTTREGLTSNTPRVVFQDREGNLWIASDGGLDMFRTANLIVDTRIASGPTLYGYRMSRSGDLLYVYVATGQETTSLVSNNHGPLYSINAAGDVQVVLEDMPGALAMAPALSGGLWLTRRDGVFRLEGNQLSPVSLPVEMSGRSVDAVWETYAGDLWAQQFGRGFWRSRDGVWTKMDFPDEDLNTLNRPMIAADGSTWFIRPDGGLSRYTDTGVQTFTRESGPSIGEYAVVFDGRDLLFVGETGIARFDGQQFRTLRMQAAAGLINATGIAQTAQDTWITVGAGILRFNTAALERAFSDGNGSAPPYELYDRREGTGQSVPLDWAIAGSNALGPDGKIWFEVAGQLATLDTANLVRNPLPPPVAIGSLTANGVKINTPRNLILPEGTTSLQLTYAALSFVEPSRIQMRYRLEGVDKDWIDPGARREAFYTQLGPGKYVFRVKASNDAGVWNEDGAVLEFEITPTFYESIWFKFIVAVTVVVLGWLAYAYSVRRAKLRMQRQFDIRIAERERIARELHDTLLQGVQGLMMRFQLVAKRAPPDGELRTSIDDALQRADAVLIEGRERVRDLRAAGFDQTLAQALLAIAGEAIEGDLPAFTATVEGTSRVLKPLVHEEVLRIAEEAIRNAVKHSKASKVDATVGFGKKELRFEVRDNGEGVGAETLAKGHRDGHFGLIGMKERAARIGATLEIRARHGAGTEVVLCIPARLAYRDGRRSSDRAANPLERESQ